MPAWLVGGDGAKGRGLCARRGTEERFGLLKRDGRAERTDRRGRGRESKGSWDAQWVKDDPVCVGIKEDVPEEGKSGREVSEEIGGSC